jgi:glycosyltransferase involved in cell wall biosynthesis
VRILVCAMEAPLPPVNGFRLHLWSLLKELRKDHDVFVLALRMPDQGEAEGDEGMRLLSYPGDRHPRRPRWLGRGILRGRTPIAVESTALLRGPLQEEVTRFRPDIVHVTTGRLAALGMNLYEHPAVLAALDAWHVNVDAEAVAASGVRRPLLREMARRVRRLEAAEFHRFGSVIVVSDRDRRELLALDGSLSIAVIPNGVDVEAFAHDGWPRDPRRIVFTGVMSYAPNVTAADFLARRVLPLVRAVHPDARLAIVGRDPRPEVRALSGLPGVGVSGEVPDIQPWLSRSRAYACPMLTGTGIKNKLLEAMANGLPSVATPLALQGLSVTPGEQVLVGRNEGELTGQLVRLLSDDAVAEAVGRAGLAYVRTHHSWTAAADAYVRVYSEVLSRSPTR